MDLTAELLPLTIPEVRRLLAPSFRPPAAPNTALRWSMWRRRHQQRARRAHWRRRQRLADPELVLDVADEVLLQHVLEHQVAPLERGVGVRFKGVEKTNVQEYCVSEGWVRLAVGKTLDRHGKPMTIKLQGPVEPYFRS